VVGMGWEEILVCCSHSFLNSSVCSLQHFTSLLPLNEFILLTSSFLPSGSCLLTSPTVSLDSIFRSEDFPVAHVCVALLLPT